MSRAIFIGYDPREDDAFRACRSSIDRWGADWHIHPLNLAELRRTGLYWRPTIESGAGRGSLRLDAISGAPMSTEFAISRFLTPLLARAIYQADWALFIDCDTILRASPAELFSLADPRFAVQVVKHRHCPSEAIKMDGQPQARYYRKNWSSVMLFNCADSANASGLTLASVNSLRGLELHRFAWLDDCQIGDLPPAWNHLVGVDAPDPATSLAHFTLGVPSMAGYEASEFADEWRALVALTAWPPQP